MPQQVHWGAWLNNKCSLLCFLFIQPSRPLNSWGWGWKAAEQDQGAVLLQENQRGRVLTLDSESIVSMLTHDNSYTPAWCEVCASAQSCTVLCNPMDYTVRGILQARILKWVAFLFQGIFATQGLNPGLPHCRWILYQLSHRGSPQMLEWVAYIFSSGSSQPRS